MNISDQANKWLSQFKIELTSSSNKVFGNRRQQLEATVSVSPRTNAIITDEQLASIALVTLDDDGVYRELNGALQASETRNTLFEYFGDTGSAPSNLEIRGPVRRKRFYISSSRSGGSLDKIYARISMDADNHYVTDIGAFKSSIIVESITPLRYEIEDFELSAEDTARTERVDIDVYYLKFKNPRLRIVKSTPHDVAYNDTPHFQFCFNTYNYGYGVDNNIASYYTHYAFEVGRERAFTVADTTVILNKRHGCMNFVRTITHTSFIRVPPRNILKPSRWWIVDQYGNDRKIEITQAVEGNRIDFKRFD